MTLVNPSILLLDPNGVLILRWAETLAADFQVETSRSIADTLAQLGEWLPEFLIVHVELRSAGPLLPGSAKSLGPIAGTGRWLVVRMAWRPWTSRQCGARAQREDERRSHRSPDGGSPHAGP